MRNVDIQGRPLRFLLTILLCWAGGRLVMSMDWAPSLPVSINAVANERPGFRFPALPARPMPALPPLSPLRAHTRPSPIRAIAATDRSPASNIPEHGDFSIAFFSRGIPGDEPTLADFAPGNAATATASVGMTAVLPADRWRGSAWLLWRADGNGGALAGAGQLGGSQAGLRVDRALSIRSPVRLAAYARLTAALDRPHAPEAAAGLAFQPSRTTPVSIAIERRIALGAGARNAFALVAAGGVGPVDLSAGMKLEGYGQAGMVGMRRRDAFIDGRLSLLHPVDATPLSVGVSLSGGAQPHIARLDIGPAVETRLPIGGRPARLTGEWRGRIAGQARPGSGFALTLAADF